MPKTTKTSAGRDPRSASLLRVAFVACADTMTSSRACRPTEGNRIPLGATFPRLIQIVETELLTGVQVEASAPLEPPLCPQDQRRPQHHHRDVGAQNCQRAQ